MQQPRYSLVKGIPRQGAFPTPTAAHRKNWHKAPHLSKSIQLFI